METVRESSLVPPLPTLWPRMLWSPARPTATLPFSAPSVRYFYFARNAVWLSVKVLGLGGSEVLVPSYHHGVEIEALLDAGAHVRFYRVGARWDVDLDDVERRITPKTKALYLIHYAGFPGPAAQMRELADNHGLMLIEDCALSLLSADGDTPLGSTGDVSIFCLYKTLPVPHGGALVVNGPRRYSLPEAPRPPLGSTLSHTASSLLQNLEMRGGGLGRALRRVVRVLARHTADVAAGRRVATGTQHFDRAHVDLGMSPWVKRLALSQDMARIVEVRRRNYFYLAARLRDISPPLFSHLLPGVCPLFFPLRVPDKLRVMLSLRQQGIETVDFWRRFHPACDEARFPETAELRHAVLEIPCHQDLGPDAMARIVTAVHDALADVDTRRGTVASH